MAEPIVAIVGCPNVGKSTLFNRLIGRRQAIVSEVPGTTRDRLYGDMEWNGIPFTLIDTGGFDPVSKDDLLQQVRAQAQVAIGEAAVILFVVDGSGGLTANDEEVADLLRRSDKPVILVVNKTESPTRRLQAVDFYRLGLGNPHLVSALHGTGTGDLLDEVVDTLPPTEGEEVDEAARIAIVGRPNVGKSSLLNRFLGQERVIVDEEPGTTRDSIDTRIEVDGWPVTLIDTAGLRRRSKVQDGLEQYSVIRALRAIDRSDVVLLLLEAPEGPTRQDARIADYVIEQGCSLMLIVNKWDLMGEGSRTRQEYSRWIYAQFPFLDYVPLLFTSAKTGWGVEEVLPTALWVQEERLVRIATGGLNKLVREWMSQHAPPSKGGRRLKLHYVTQADIDPPTFVFFVNDPQLVIPSYTRYLENRLREVYRFVGTPLRLSFRSRDQSTVHGSRP
ncbi:MAG: ribosome biogenesis GTPase Der [Chloroflexota bacterium]|nr:ribosome biogenesis GTPase Der [Chloroflexota bacterium]